MLDAVWSPRRDTLTDTSSRQCHAVRPRWCHRRLLAHVKSQDRRGACVWWQHVSKSRPTNNPQRPSQCIWHPQQSAFVSLRFLPFSDCCSRITTSRWQAQNGNSLPKRSNFCPCARVQGTGDAASVQALSWYIEAIKANFIGIQKRIVHVINLKRRKNSSKSWPRCFMMWLIFLKSLLFFAKFQDGTTRHTWKMCMHLDKLSLTTNLTMPSSSFLYLLLMLILQEEKLLLRMFRVKLMFPRSCGQLSLTNQMSSMNVEGNSAKVMSDYSRDYWSGMIQDQSKTLSSATATSYVTEIPTNLSASAESDESSMSDESFESEQEEQDEWMTCYPSPFC